MANSAVSSQVQALLKPAEPALAEAYFAQVRYWDSLKSIEPNALYVSRQCFCYALILLQVTRDLGAHLQVRETADQKGRGVFTTQVILLNLGIPLSEK